MKIRQGFVSNSSSSSFVISAPKDVEEITVTFKMNIKKGVRRFENLHEWTKYIEKEYGWGKCRTIEDICQEDEWAEEIYKKGRDALESGQEDLVVIWVSNESDDPLNNLFYEDPSAFLDAASRAGCIILTNG